MATGGGFCEKHGPYDPPHRTCPFCARENEQRQAYGPPPERDHATPPPDTTPADAFPVPEEQPDAPPVDLPAGDPLVDDLPPADLPLDAVIEAMPAHLDSGFVRATVDPLPVPGVTEVAPRPDALDAEAGPDDDGPREPLAWLVVKEPGTRRGDVLTVRANQIIGRNGDVQWSDPRLSRQHARLTLEPPASAPDDPPVFHLWPFGTTNPVFVNGQPIRGATPLHENDEVRLGDTLFVVKILMD